MFENVNYQFYRDTLERSTVPDEKSFNDLKLENIQFMKRILPYVEEREENGIDTAVCLMIEKQFSVNQLITEPVSVSSESVSGHSISYDNTAKNKAVEQNSKSLDAQKMECVKLFCTLHIGGKW